MKNGWGLSTMIVFCGVIGVCLIFSIVMYKTNVEKEIDTSSNENYNIVNKTYLGLEEDVALLSKEYFESNDKDIVTIKKLVKLGYMESVYDLKDASLKCSGYVKVSKVNNKNNYQTYLKCGSNYETTGYMENLDD